MRYRNVSVLLLALAIIGGCAVGNKYDYGSVTVALPVKGNGALAVGVVENRPYVLNGQKHSDFIGIQRGGFGNPFEVTTSTGNPLADDMAKSLAVALTNSGFTVSTLGIQSPDEAVIATTIARDGRPRNIILTVNEWKTDVMMRIRVLYDLELKVADNTGRVLAINSLKGDEVIGGGGFEGQNARSASSAFETKIGRLFNSPEIIAALEK
jgi:hypothetical protein